MDRPMPKPQWLHWDDSHASYACEDNSVIHVPKMKTTSYSFVDNVGDAIASGLPNGLVTRVNCKPHSG